MRRSIAALTATGLVLVALTLSPGLVGCEARPAAGVEPERSPEAIASLFPHPEIDPDEVEVGGRPLAQVIGELEDLIPRLMERNAVPGLSLALIVDGRVVWARGFGVKDVRTGDPVTTVSVFRGASLTKQFVAYAALNMVEEGLLELDRPLNDYLDEPYLADPRVTEVTLRMVLSHSSGFSHSGYDKGAIYFTPGDHYYYSNAAFLYLQHVMETVTGMPLERYLAENLFQPLGMNETSLVWEPAYEALATIGHDWAEPVAPYRPTSAHGAFGILTTPTDYAKLLLELMNAGDGDRYRLSRETVEAMIIPQVKAGTDLWWGLGVGLEKAGPGKTAPDESEMDSAASEDAPALDIWQWGWITGYRNYMTASLEDRVGLVIMTNGAGGLYLCEEIAVAALGRAQLSFPGLLDFFLD